MRCPYCGSDNTKVTDSRDSEDGIRRRRECLQCEQRFTTMERPVSGELLVAKKDGRREEFSRDKLLSGLRRACEKRPLRAGSVEAVADAIESSLRRRGAPEVTSTEVGEMVMDHLRELDHIAYIRFASVYRSFADLEELQRELQALEARSASGAGQATLLPEEDLRALTRGIRSFPARRPGAPRRKARANDETAQRSSPAGRGGGTGH